MPVSRDEVIHAFRLILGREPTEEPAIAAHMELADTQELATVLLRSAEFQTNPRFKDFMQVRPADQVARFEALPHAVRAGFRALVIGNCQVASIARLLQAMTGDVAAESLETTPSMLAALQSGERDIGAQLAAADLVFVQLIDEVTQLIRDRYPEHAAKIRAIPPINYSAFHPDCVYIRKADGSHLKGPMGDYHSSIVFWAWSEGWSPEETVPLFDAATYELLEFDAQEPVSRKVLLGFGRQANLPLDALVHEWERSGAWMHTINHPTVRVLADLTAEILRREGVDPILEGAALVQDHLVHFPVWPVYPPLAARLGVAGSYLFKVDRGMTPASRPHMFLNLEDFVAASFACYEAGRSEGLRCDRVRGAPYDRLATLRHSVARPPVATVPVPQGWLARLFGRAGAEGEAPAGSAAPVNPYDGLPDDRFWRRSVERVAASEVDPVVQVRWKIGSGDKVATAGSCFAQHIARTLHRNGLHYFVTEAGEELPAAEREERQYGVYSARYGNLYTARQLVQLFERAYGRLRPLDSAWQRPDGRWVDAFRPQIEPAGFASPEEVEAAREPHLAAVRTMFEQMDVFVFTLGLTESWQRLEDGVVFPLAPGVVAGSFDESRYRFVNFTVADVVDDIRSAVLRIRSINPRARFIFTVSPVPLIATYENRHVLVSTVESKAILRAAIGEVAAANPQILYFPSFEIVTGLHAGNRYFASDLRSVTDEGVAHVMRVFMRHVTTRGAASEPAAPRPAPAAQHAERMEAEQRALAQVICDEEAIDRHRGG